MPLACAQAHPLLVWVLFAYLFCPALFLCKNAGGICLDDAGHRRNNRINSGKAAFVLQAPERSLYAKAAFLQVQISVNFGFWNWKQNSRFGGKEIMKYRYIVSKERYEFFKEQEKLAREYREAGMTEEQIEAMFEYDYELMKKDRVFKQHNDFIDFGAVENGVSEEPGFPLGDYLERFSRSLEDFAVRDRFGWIEDVEDPDLYAGLRKLPMQDVELITMYAIEGFSMTEIAKIRGNSPQAVSKKIRKLKKFLKNFC